MNGQFTHWNATDIRNAFDVHRLYPARIAKMTGRTVKDVISILTHYKGFGADK